MEVMELADLRKAFLPSENRYVNPHVEAMRLKKLWTFDDRPRKSKETQRVDQLLSEARQLVEAENFPEGLRLITKALLINPRQHNLHALRGDIFMKQDKIDLAIRSYEEARRMVKFDKTSEKKSYTRYLMEMYRKRGLMNGQKNRLVEAASDFEQVLALKPHGSVVFEIQDELLNTLKKMNKYEAFRYEWTRFMNDADPSRASTLLTRYADYKIFRREMSSARHLLFEAIDLDSANFQAHELLQVIYDTGHDLVAYSIIWSVCGCHDKALIAVEKARDCDPYNPGYTLLKAIILRLSGRLLEAAKWLESVDTGFKKLLEPSRDKQGSIMGNLSIEQTRTQLIEQWHFIRYDIAIEFMLEQRYQDALKILKSSKLKDLFPETEILMGDCLVKLKEKDQALRMYTSSLAKLKKMKKLDPKSKKYVYLLKRISDLLNVKCDKSIEEGKTKEAIQIANEIVQILDKDFGTASMTLGQNLGEALICKARAYYQAEEVSKSSAYSPMAEGFKLTRGVDDHGVYSNIFYDEKLEGVVNKFGKKRNLPESMKLLMQYS